MNYYGGLTNYFSAINSAEQNKFGEAVGYIQVAESKLNECGKLKFSKDNQENLKFTIERIEAK